MAAGKRFGAADLSAATATLLWTQTAGKTATVWITMCNRDSANPSDVRIALVDGGLGDLAAEDYFEYDAEIRTNAPLVRTGVVVPGGYSIVVYSSLANVTAMAWGFEETDA